jgi:catechol 2,3-dioxygenase-like lactoylglutathione lyase family enzyme
MGHSTDRRHSVPSISGRLEVSLTVSDPASSAAWYSELLGLDVLYDFAGDSHKSQVAKCPTLPAYGSTPPPDRYRCIDGHRSASGVDLPVFRDSFQFVIAAVFEVEV